MREEMYKIAKEMSTKIQDFENAIHRPYFHIKPLDDAQPSNWHHYLDFIEKTNDFDWMVKLFERCLIACANYPEYWICSVQGTTGRHSTYPNDQAQWGADYAQQSQSWQQPPAQQDPKAQPQQWMPGYGQQAGYALYASYDNYGPPQQPTNPTQQKY
ncbi:hypothetical protein SUGI_0833000 [Cryptomeria japonica]|nr:hypothetical protein SUGI_0833000 [Cryptomeria japonica]